ncbi:MAG: stage II sporulation protein M [Planctomycetota bacterium]
MSPLDLNRFIQIRRPRWQRLEALLDRVEQRGLETLSRNDLDELYGLYRHASSDLNWAQTQTGNPALLDYLEVTVGRAYGLLAPPARARPFAAWWSMVRHGLPAIVRANAALFFLSAAVFLAGGLFGGVSTSVQPDLARVFLPAEHLTQTPSERVADLEQREREGDPQVDGQGFALFSMFLFSHNIRVCLLAFGLGLTFGIGTAIILFYNGALLGCIAYRYFEDGVGEFFVAWVGPHAAIELPCVIFAGMAGFMIGRAQWRKDGGVPWRRLSAIRRPLLTVVVATASWLVVAGWIEGGFSQINEPTLPYPLKIAVAGVLFVGLMAYLFVIPVGSTTKPNASDELA